MSVLDGKIRELERFIEREGKEGVVIAFSGGLDSSTLAAVSHNVLGERVVAVTAKSPTYTPEELEDAVNVAREIGIKFYVVETDELSNEDFSKNPENRCYYCKKELLKSLHKTAGELGFKAVFEGTNLSDLAGHRPGFVAVKELAYTFSPWVETGFTKDEIRFVAKQMGLSVEDKPSNACLASRVPFHERITAEKLSRIGKAEQIIKELTGVRQLRVRDHNGLARIEVEKNERKLLCDAELLDKLAVKLKAIGFKYVTIDAEGYRTGSMLLTKDENKK